MALSGLNTEAADLSLVLVIDRFIPGINRTPYFFGTHTNLFAFYTIEILSCIVGGSTIVL